MYSWLQLSSSESSEDATFRIPGWYFYSSSFITNRKLLGKFLFKWIIQLKINTSMNIKDNKCWCKTWFWALLQPSTSSQTSMQPVMYLTIIIIIIITIIIITCLPDRRPRSVRASLSPCRQWVCPRPQRRSSPSHSHPSLEFRGEKFPSQ